MPWPFYRLLSAIFGNNKGCVDLTPTNLLISGITVVITAAHYFVGSSFTCECDCHGAIDPVNIFFCFREGVNRCCLSFLMSRLSISGDAAVNLCSPISSRRRKQGWRTPLLFLFPPLPLVLLVVSPGLKRKGANSKTPLLFLKLLTRI